MIYYIKREKNIQNYFTTNFIVWLLKIYVIVYYVACKREIYLKIYIYIFFNLLIILLF